MNRFISHKFRFYSFVCITLLLFVHGYNLQETYLRPYSLVQEPLSLTTFTEYLFANGLLRFRLPMLFIFSGFIFAMQDYRPFGLHMQRRVKTLLLPYFIWSAVGLAITYLWQQFPVTAQAVKDAQLDQLTDNRPYSEIGWAGVLYRWVLAPPSFQLWFIRSLFFYNLIYPVIRWALGKSAIVWIVFTALLWVTNNGFLFFEGQGLFFFSVGVWLYKTNYPIDKKPAWFSYYLSWLLFVGLSVIKTFMAFEFEEYTTANVITMSTLYVLSSTAGVLAVWYSGDAIVRWAMRRRWFVWAASFSFIVYALHEPLLHYLIRVFYLYGNSITGYRLITYLIAPSMIFSFCLAVGAAFRRLFPKAYKLATGGRGL